MASHIVGNAISKLMNLGGDLLKIVLFRREKMSKIFKAISIAMRRRLRR